MRFLKLATYLGACIGLGLSGVWAADLSDFSGGVAKDAPGGDLGYKDGASGDYWIVTAGALGGAAPLFPGSKIEGAALLPQVDIHRPGAMEWLGLPTDTVNFTLYHDGFFRAGASADYLFNRTSSLTSAVRGLRDIDYTIELGGFAEYYPTQFLRLRADALQGVTGSDGFEGRLKADFIYQAGPDWLFTAGPRLDFVNTQYSSSYYSVSSSEAILSHLPTFHASGGLNSAGVDVTARYYVSDNFSLRGFADWERLVSDAADSPIVRYRGSSDQFQFGIGAAFRFIYSH